MALPATGTATRDGSCCCGGTCCCGWGSEVCVTFADVPVVYCPENPGVDCTECARAVFEGLSVTLTLAGPCSWEATVTDPNGVGNVTLGITLGCADLAGASLTCVFSMTDPGLGTPSYCGGTRTLDQWAAPGACDPATFSDPNHDRSLAPTFDFDLTGMTATVTDGACGAVLAVLRAALEPPCRWRGAELTGGERAALALDHRKTWHRCGRPDFPRLGLPVTGCRACKAADMKCSRSGCVGYEPADVDGRPDV